MASGADEGALRDALLRYVGGLGEAAQTTDRSDATRWGNLVAIDAAPPVVSS
jgi:hypothetical protein